MIPKTDAMVVTFINGYGETIDRKGYFIDPPDRGAGGEPQFQWTLTEQPFGFFFWVESGGRLLVQDVVPTAGKVVRINIDAIQVDYQQIKMDSQTPPLTDAKSVR